MENYKLYIMPNCPFCKKVVKFMKKNNIDLEVLDIADEDHRKDLQELGGMTQVPALRKDDDIMYESMDIIDYMKENFL